MSDNLLEAMKQNINRVDDFSGGSSKVTAETLVENLSYFAAVTALRTDQSAGEAAIVFESVLKTKSALANTAFDTAEACLQEGIMENIKEAILRFLDIIVGIFRKSDVVKALEKVKEDSDWNDKEKESFKAMLTRYKDMRKDLADVVKKLRESFKEQASKNAISSASANAINKNLNKEQRLILSEDRRMVAQLKGKKEKWSTIETELNKHHNEILSFKKGFESMLASVKGQSSLDT